MSKENETQEVETTSTEEAPAPNQVPELDPTTVAPPSHDDGAAEQPHEDREVTGPVSPGQEPAPAADPGEVVVPAEDEQVPGSEEAPGDGDNETTVPDPAEAEDDEEDETPVSEFTSDPKAQAEITRLRQENARRRIENRELRENGGLGIEGADPEFSEGWAQLGAAFINDPESAKGILAELAGAEVPANETPTVPTPEELEERISGYFARKEADLARQAAAAALHSEAKELGFDPDAEPGTAEFAKHQVLWSYVKSQPEGERDLKAAADSVAEYEQKVFDRKLAELKEANQDFPSVATGRGAASATPPKEQKRPGQGSNAAQAVRDAYEKSVALEESRKN